MSKYVGVKQIEFSLSRIIIIIVIPVGKYSS